MADDQTGLYSHETTFTGQQESFERKSVEFDRIQETLERGVAGITELVRPFRNSCLLVCHPSQMEQAFGRLHAFLLFHHGRGLITALGGHRKLLFFFAKAPIVAAASGSSSCPCRTQMLNLLYNMKQFAVLVMPQPPFALAGDGNCVYPDLACPPLPHVLEF